MREDPQLIALKMLTRKSFFIQYNHYFKEEHFRTLELQMARKAIEKIYENDPQRVSTTLWEVQMQLSAWGMDMEEYRPVLKRLREIPATPDKFRQKLVKDFLTQSTLRGIFRTNLEKLSMHETPDMAVLKSEIDRVAMDLGDEEGRRRGDYATSLPEYLQTDFVIPIHLHAELDRSMAVGGGEIAVIEALIHSGKSTACVNIGVLHAKAGGNAVVITADEPRRRYVRRFDQCVLGVTVEDLFLNPVLTEKARDNVRSWGGSIEIIDVTHEKTTVATIGNRLDQLELAGRSPTMLVVDYPDRLFEPGSSDPKQKVDAVYGELARLASKYNLPVWVVSQINRESYSKHPTFGMSAGSSTKEEMASSIMVLQRNPGLDEQRKVEAYVLKSRNGVIRNRRIALNVDWDRQLIWG
jgi:hypothetical protein